MNAFKKARIVQGLTQVELAKKLGVSSVAVSKWERGTGLPNVKRMKEVADALNLTVNELLESETRAI